MLPSPRRLRAPAPIVCDWYAHIETASKDIRGPVTSNSELFARHEVSGEQTDRSQRDDIDAGALLRDSHRKTLPEPCWIPFLKTNGTRDFLLDSRLCLRSPIVLHDITGDQSASPSETGFTVHSDCARSGLSYSEKFSHDGIAGSRSVHKIKILKYQRRRS